MKRHSTRALIMPGAAFLGTAALGWQLGDVSKPKQVSFGDNPPSRFSHSTRPTRRDDGAVEQVRAILAAASPEAKMRATVALANSISASDFPKWVEGDKFSVRSGPELTVFRMILFERWRQEAPETLIGWAVHNNYGQAGRALVSFAKSNPELLINHFRHQPDPKAELEILKEVAKHHPTIALARLQLLSNGAFPSETARKADDALNELAKRSPAELAAALDTLSPELRRLAESALCGQRLATSFATELSALSTQSGGWQVFAENLSKRPELASQLIQHLSQLPPDWKGKLAENWSYYGFRDGKAWFESDLEGAGFSPAQARSIKGNALRRLASTDPEFALKNLAAGDDAIKESVVATALQNANGDQARMTQLIALISSEEDRQCARDLLPELTARLTERNSQPQEWLHHLSELDDATLPMAAARTLQRWDMTQEAELREVFRQMPLDQRHHIAALIASSDSRLESTSGFVGDAVRLLVTHPPSTDGLNVDPVLASSSYAARLVTRDPAAAISWIDSLPDGPAKLWAQKNTAANWQQYDPPAAQAWIQSLPPGSQQEVTQHLQSRRK